MEGKYHHGHKSRSKQPCSTIVQKEAEQTYKNDGDRAKDDGEGAKRRFARAKAAHPGVQEHVIQGRMGVLVFMTIFAMLCEAN